MNPSPLLPHSINLLLQYISPPSQLDAPLPPHLISKSLLQRHHFLHLSHSDPTPYLSWPSPNQHQTIQLLESLPTQFHGDQYPSFPVRYTSDPEYTYAHVRLTPDDQSGLRIIFQWDKDDGWKYHNADLMPFPPLSYPSPHDAVSNSLYPPIHQPQHDSLQDHAASIQAANDHPSHDDDSYWNAYGQDNEQDVPSIFNISTIGPHTATEDAYWAQYSSVQGSGDSTMPSPQSQKRKLNNYPDPAYPIRYDTDLDEPLVFLDSVVPPPTAYDPLVPPSPETLARRLAALVTDDDLPDDWDSASPSPTVEMPGLSVAPKCLVGSESFLDDQELGKDGGAAVRARLQVTDDEAVRDSLRDVYRLWKAGRRTRGLASIEDGELFLNIAREVVREP